MKHSEYWKGRKTQRMWEHMQRAEDTAEEISKLYLHASQYINNNINGIFDKYAAKHKLSKLEAKQLLNSLEDPTDFQAMLNRLKAGVSSDEKDELIKMLEAPAYRSRINRLEKLQSDIDVMMHSVYRQEKDFNTVNYTNVAHDAYYKSIYDIQSLTGYSFSFNQLNPVTVDKLLHSKWSGINYSERIWNNTQAVAKEIKEQLLMAMITGKTETEIAQEIANKYSTASMYARRLIRTESCYIAEELEAQSYEECGAKKYIFLATLDIKTSEECRELDMKTFLLKEREVGVNCPPMHPWCRSTTIIGMDEDVLKGLQRRARDPETGENYIVDGNTSYKDWFADQEKKHGADKVDTIADEIVQSNPKNIKQIQQISKKTIKDINDEATNNLLSAYERRRIDKGMNVVPAEQLKKNNLSESFKGNYEGVSVETANAFNNTISKLSDEYYTGLTTIKVGEKKDFFGVSEHARVEHQDLIGQKTLVLNPFKTENYDKLIEKIEDLSKQGYSVNISKGRYEEYIATHEFAHSLVTMNGSLKNYVGLDTKEPRMVRKKIKSIYKEYVDEIDTLNEQIRVIKSDKDIFSAKADLHKQMEAFKKLADAQNSLKKTQISRYSLLNEDEFFAEAFTHSKLADTSNQFADRVMEVIDEHYKIKTHAKEDVNRIQKASNNITKSNSKLIFEDTISFDDKDYTNELISGFKEQYSNQDIEYGMLLSPKNKAFVVKGTESTNDFSMLADDVFKDAIAIHNHPDKKTHYSFSGADVNFFLENGLQESYAFDGKYEYQMKRTKDTLSKSLEIDEFKNIFFSVIDENMMNDENFIAIDDKDEYHVVIERLAKKYKFIYERRIRK